MVALGCTSVPPPDLFVAHCAQGFENPVGDVSTAGVRYASLDGESTTTGPSVQEIEAARRRLAIAVQEFLADDYPPLRQFDLYFSSWAFVSGLGGVRLYGLHSRYRLDPSWLIADGGSDIICSWHDRESGRVLAIQIHPNA